MERASEDDFFRLSKEDHWEKLHGVVKARLIAGGIAGHQETGKRVRAALDRIKTESRLNALRVARHLGGR